jgi:hypothetical protein
VIIRCGVRLAVVREPLHEVALEVGVSFPQVYVPEKRISEANVVFPLGAALFHDVHVGRTDIGLGLPDE